MTKVSSPSPRQTMDFPSAVVEVMNGRRVTRIEWGDASIYIFMAGGFLCISQNAQTKEKGAFAYLAAHQDVYAKDWVTADDFAA